MIAWKPSARDLKCCGNCMNNEGSEDVPALRCDFPEMNEEGEGYAVNPHAVCDKWTFDQSIYGERGTTYPEE